MSDPISPAIVSEAVTRITSFLTGKYSEHKNVKELIERLVTARLLLKGAVKESEALKEEFGIDIDEELHKLKEIFKEGVCEADEVLSNFQAEILHEEPNQTIEGGSSARDQQMKEEGSDDATLVHTASNIREAVTRQVDLEANLPHDPFMQEERSDDATLVHTASNLRETVPRQVDQEANLTHNQPMQEEGSDDATLVHPTSNLRETVPRQVDQEAHLTHNQPMQEEGSDDATLVHPTSNLRETIVPRQVDQEANLAHDQPMQEEGSDDATLVHPGSHLWETVPRQVDQEANLAHDQPMQEEGSDDETLVHPGSDLRETVPRQVDQEANLAHDQLMQEERSDDGTFVPPVSFATIGPRLFKVLRSDYWGYARRVSMLKSSVGKLERMSGNVGIFLKLLELQKKRKLSRKRKEWCSFTRLFSGYLSQITNLCFILLWEDPYLLVIMLFRANFNLPTGITGYIFIGYIM